MNKPIFLLQVAYAIIVAMMMAVVILAVREKVTWVAVMFSLYFFLAVVGYFVFTIKNATREIIAAIKGIKS